MMTRELEARPNAAWHAARRTRVDGVTLRSRVARRRTAGFTILELIMVTVVLATVVSIALPRLRDTNRYGAWNAQNQFLGDLRLTRSWAITSGDHYILRVTDATHYAIWRMTLDDGAWVVTGDAVRQRTLPGGVSVAVDDDPDDDDPLTSVAEFEFDTRGALVLPGGTVADVTEITMHDANIGATKRLSVWPSGQVAPL